MLRTPRRTSHVTEAASLRVQAGEATKPDAEPRQTFDKSPVRESRTPGSVGEALSNQRLYPTLSVVRTHRGRAMMALMP